jgi:hypothetical protein
MAAEPANVVPLIDAGAFAAVTAAAVRAARGMCLLTLHNSMYCLVVPALCCIWRHVGVHDSTLASSHWPQS